MAAILFLGTRDPIAAPLAVGLGAVLVAAVSATQDIVIDAFRIESLRAEEQAAGMASYVATYRIGMLASGAGAIGLAAWLEAQGVARDVVWPIAYAAAAALVLVGMVAVLAAREPGAVTHNAVEHPDAAATLQRIFETARGAFSEFLLRDAAVVVLAFVVLYKLCDALAGVMTAPFILALGYDKGTYAGIVKGVGLIATLAGGFAGGALAGAMTLGQALWLGGLLQMASNLVFVWLGSVAPSVPALTAAIIVENVTGGIATVIFVAYISALCGVREHTATQYALLTALVAVGRTLLASTSGYGVAALGWPMFFLATAIAALPSLALLAWLQRRGHFARLDAREREVF
jgi:PAT family beta-lactamase induction signal transducer AmpG